MRDVVIDSFVFWPMPIVWLLVTVLIAGRRRSWSRLLFGAAVVLLLVGCMPITSRLLSIPLAAAAPSVGPADRPAGVDAVVVATAGNFRDASGTWRSEPSTIRRLVVALFVRERLGVPLIVTGGSPRASGQQTEAVTAVRDLDLDETDFTRREDAARNSSETGYKVAAMLRDVNIKTTKASVVLVTSQTHIARMAASLRHAGVHVVGATSPEAYDRESVPLDNGFSSMPSIKGLLQVGGALYEYVGIAWYLALGMIDISELRPPSDP